MPQEASHAPNWASLIIEDIEEVFFSVDASWRFTYLNHHATRVLGHSKEDLVGNVLWDVFPVLIGTRFEQIYRQAMLDRVPQRFEDIFAINQSWYDTRIFPTPQGLIIYLQDITARKRAEAELQRQAERVRAQAEISRTLAEVTSDYQATLDTAARQLAEIIGDACIIRLIAEDAQWIEFTASYHPDPATAAFVRDVLIGTHHQRVTEGLAGRSVQTGQPVLIPVISSEQIKANTHPEHWPYLDRFTVSSVLIVPLRATGRVIGIIAMNRDAPGRPYTNDDLTLLQDLSDRVAIAITNARLLQQVQNELAERTRADLALRSSEERFKTLSAAAYEALFIHENRRIIEVNQQTTEMYGYTRDELIGMLFDQLTAPEYMTALYERVAQNSTLTSESIGVRKDGSHFFVESRGRPSEYQGKQVRIAAVRDITELKQAEQERALLAAIVASSEDAIIGKDLDGIILSWNMGAELLYGYTGAETIGRSMALLIPADHPDEVAAMLDMIRQGKHVTHYETQRVRRDLTLVDVALTISPIKDRAGTLIGASSAPAMSPSASGSKPSCCRRRRWRLSVGWQAGSRTISITYSPPLSAMPT